MSRWHPFFCLFSVAPAFVSCHSLPEPRVVVNKAIAAHGGQKNIAKPRKGILKGVVKDDSEIRQEEVFDLPRRWKRTTTGVHDDAKKVSFNLFVDGTLWAWEPGGAVRETKHERIATPQFGLITKLLELTDPKVTLAATKRTLVNGEPAIGVRAKFGNAEGDFYFDEKSGLCVQTNFVWERAPGQPFDIKMLLANYREVDGIQLPHRRTVFGKGGMFKEFTLITDFFITDVQILDSIPEEAFSKP